MAKEWIVSEEDLGCDGAYFSHDEVVRCKDCRWSCLNNCECIRNRLYRHNSISLEVEPYFRKIEPDDFCSWGERRQDE